MILSRQLKSTIKDEFYSPQSILFTEPARFWSAVTKRARVRVNEIVTTVGLTGGEKSSPLPTPSSCSYILFVIFVFICNTNHMVYELISNFELTEPRLDLKV